MAIDPETGQFLQSRDIAEPSNRKLIKGKPVGHDDLGDIQTPKIEIEIVVNYQTYKESKFLIARVRVLSNSKV